MRVTKVELSDHCRVLHDDDGYCVTLVRGEVKSFTRYGDEVPVDHARVADMISASYTVIHSALGGAE